MKCLNCGEEFEAERTDAKFCSTNCRATFSRKSKDKPYSLVEGKVYGRQAVSYGEESNSLGAKWNTRPEPENPEDIPDKDNRGNYYRKDGSEYIIDAVGSIVNR